MSFDFPKDLWKEISGAELIHNSPNGRLEFSCERVVFTLSPGSFFSGVLVVSDNDGRAFGGLEQP